MNSRFRDPIEDPEQEATLNSIPRLSDDSVLEQAMQQVSDLLIRLRAYRPTDPNSADCFDLLHELDEAINSQDIDALRSLTPQAEQVIQSLESVPYYSQDITRARTEEQLIVQARNIVNDLRERAHRAFDLGAQGEVLELAELSIRIATRLETELDNRSLNEKSFSALVQFSYNLSNSLWSTMNEAGLVGTQEPPTINEALPPINLSNDFFRRSGHIRPARRYRDANAASGYVRSIERNILAQIRRTNPAFIPQGESIVPQDLQERAIDLGNQALEILTQSGNLPPEVLRRLRISPPVFCVISDRLFNTQYEYYRADLNAAYIPGSNVIVINSIMFKNEVSTEDLISTLYHEIFHYAADLGGGLSDIRVNTEDGFVRYGRVLPIHEGLTEYFTHYDLRSIGQNPSIDSYPYAMMTAFYIDQLMQQVLGEREGRQALRNAYITGDFTRVAGVLDGALGQGTSERLLGCFNGIENSIFIRQRLQRAGYPVESWDQSSSIIQDISILLRERSLA